MNKKFFTIVALVAVVSIAGLLVYAAFNSAKVSLPLVLDTTNTTGTTTPTTSTSTVTDNPSSQNSEARVYKNSQYGFEFEYPVSYRNSTAERNSLVPIVTLEKEDSAIAVRSITPKSGETYEHAVMQDVVYDGSGNNPQSFNEFKSRTIAGNTFNYIVVGRFEGVVTVNYYLKRNTDILVFSSQSRNVTNWSNPSFNVENDETHKTLQSILSTLKLSTPVVAITSIKLYYTNPKSSDANNSCVATAEVVRSIPKTVAVADASLKELFKGPTQSEKNAGLTNNVNANDYIGVTVTNGLATVNFRRAALTYLNGPVCMQGSVKSSIEKTLKQFSSITRVQYAIDGEVFTEWDA